ncbi:MAG: hypothetical protein DRG24_01650 [Epsilonproteobacteria bacterium]|nr:MAG: hypothetical protein DRG24_01650 [Campylobacterota bacterium]
MGNILAVVLVLVYVAYVMTGGIESTSSSFNKSTVVSKHAAPSVAHTASAVEEVASKTEHVTSKIHLSQKEMRHTIKAAGEENGWLMTEYKGNTLIAEKIEEDGMVSVTVTFDSSSFSIEPENTALDHILNSVLH